MELAVCRVAVLNGADYEWFAHAKLARQGGVSREVLGVCLELGELKGKEERREGVSEVQWAVLRFTDAMTRRVKVEEEVFDEVKGVLGETGVVELTATVAAYNCVSRFLVALDVGEWNGRGMVVPE